MLQRACHEADLLGVPFLYRDLGDPVADVPVDARGGQGDVEGNAVVPGSQGFEVRPDLIGHIPGAGGAVRAHDHQIHLTVLHQVAPGVVDDHRMGHTGLGQFPGGQSSALIPGASLVHPHVERNAPAVRFIDRRGGRSVAHAGQPAGVAVGQYIDGALFLFVDFFDQSDPVFPDQTAAFDILRFDFPGGSQRCGDPPLRIVDIPQSLQLAFHRPGQIDCGGAGG